MPTSEKEMINVYEPYWLSNAAWSSINVHVCLCMCMNACSSNRKKTRIMKRSMHEEWRWYGQWIRYYIYTGVIGTNSQALANWYILKQEYKFFFSHSTRTCINFSAPKYLLYALHNAHRNVNAHLRRALYNVATKFEVKEMRFWIFILLYADLVALPSHHFKAHVILACFFFFSPPSMSTYVVSRIEIITCRFMYSQDSIKWVCLRLINLNSLPKIRCAFFVCHIAAFKWLATVTSDLLFDISCINSDFSEKSCLFLPTKKKIPKFLCSTILKRLILPTKKWHKHSAFHSYHNLLIKHMRICMYICFS